MARCTVVAIATWWPLLIIEPARRAFVVKASRRTLIAITTLGTLIVAIAAWALVIETSWRAILDPTRWPLIIAELARRPFVVEATGRTLIVAEPARRAFIVKPARWAIFETTWRTLVIGATGRTLIVAESARRAFIVKPARWAIFETTRRTPVVRATRWSLVIAKLARRTFVVKPAGRAIALCAARRLTAVVVAVAARWARFALPLGGLWATLRRAQRQAVAVQVGRAQRFAAGGANGVAFVVAAHTERGALAGSGGALGRVVAALVVVAREIVRIGSHESKPVRLALRWRAHQAVRFQARAAVWCPGSGASRRPGKCLPRVRPAC